jgi:Zn finger protein HypA/HybF involved in hydrogenase expression
MALIINDTNINIRASIQVEASRRNERNRVSCEYCGRHKKRIKTDKNMEMQK